MLGLQMLEESEWSNLRFSVAIGAGASGNPVQMHGIEDMVDTLSDRVGRDDGKYPGYSVQASGVKDVWYKDGKHVAKMCARDRTRTMDYRDGHVVPRQKGEVLKLVHLINDIDEASKASTRNVEQAVTSPMDSMPPFLDRGDSRTASTYMHSIAGVSS